MHALVVRQVTQKAAINQYVVKNGTHTEERETGNVCLCAEKEGEGLWGWRGIKSGGVRGTLVMTYFLSSSSTASAYSEDFHRATGGIHVQTYQQTI